jgi:HTH-type transcriptional regulator/antitoxin HigA
MPGKTNPRSRSDWGGEADARRVPDSYFELVGQFALIHIRDDDHLAEALDVLDRLLARDLDAGGQEYVDVLADLIEAYEDEHVAIPDASEADVLRGLMRSNGLTQSELRRRTGIAQSTISAVLNGDRSLTKDQVVALADFFRVSPAAFLPGSP